MLLRFLMSILLTCFLLSLFLEPSRAELIAVSDSSQQIISKSNQLKSSIPYQLEASSQLKLLSQQATPSPLQQLSVLEANLSTSWLNNDLQNFQSASTDSLADAIPKAVKQIGSEVTAPLENVGKILSSIFSILFTVGTITYMYGSILFFQNKAYLYALLQDNFIKVNARMKSSFHAIRDLQKVVECGQAMNQVNEHMTQISAFFKSFLVMMEQAQRDRDWALAVWDTELRQYQSSKTLLELHKLLSDGKSNLYASILTNCAKGSAQDFLKMMVELQHTFMQAIILDSVAKIRLHNNTITKRALDADRVYWKNQVTKVADLMAQTASNLVTQSWYTFYKNDIASSLSKSSADRAPNAAGNLANLLTLKYPYVRTAVIIAPWDVKSIAITDAFGSPMGTVSKDSFICYNSKRTNGNGKLEPVIVLCRNTIAYPTEQSDLDSAYATYSRNVLSLSLLDALRNNQWDDISNIMKENSVSFFAVKVDIHLNSGSVSTAQPAAAADMVFFQSNGTRFQALVIAKLIRATPVAKTAINIVSPNKASSIRALLPVTGASAAIVFIAACLRL